MTDTTASATAACASPYCSKPIVRAATGRPARYCSDRCRQDAKRARDRAAADAAELAAQLRHALHAVEDTGDQLSGSVHGYFVPEVIARVHAAATDPRGDAAELEKLIGFLALEVRVLTQAARDHRAALDKLAELENRQARG